MMKRIDITISEIHIKKLKQLSKQGGMNVSEVIRRAIDLYYEETKKKGGVNRSNSYAKDTRQGESVVGIRCP
jgi:metal-responsive CopG/Arc/MetJ family transcriptional regulator